jgi:hypothetical protein
MTATPSPTAADLRARLAAAWERAHAVQAAEVLPLVEHLADAPAPPGWSVWRVGGEGGPVTALPALAAGPAAPMDVQRRYLARVLANCSGRCPSCGAVANLPSADPERTPAAWQVAPVTVGIVHAPECPAVFTEADRGHFDPRAVGHG